MKRRKQFFYLLIGTNGTGKTTLGIQIAVKYLQANPGKRVLFLLSDDGDKKLKDVHEIERDQLLTFKGVKKMMVNHEKDFVAIADTFKSFRDKNGKYQQREFNGLIIADDLGGAMGRRPEPALQWFRKRRQPNIDFMFMFHGLRTQVPPSFYTFVNKIILFRTSDKVKGILNELPDDKVEEFEQMYIRVQQRSMQEPHYKEEIILTPLDI